MKKCLAILCSLFIGLSIVGVSYAQEALPQMQKVTFSEDAGSPVPEDPEDHFSPSEASYSEDGLSYHDDSLDVQLHCIRAYDTDIVVAFVQISQADQMKSELAKPYPSKATLRFSEIVKRVDAVLAVNGDWFTYHNEGIIYRNGELLRDREDEETDGLAIDINGDFHIVRPMTQEAYAQITVPIETSFAFGPALVMDGEVLEIVNRAVTYKQRMAIGQVDHLSYVLVATDGPDQEGSLGLSVPQLAELMYGLGAHTAYNLDGGQSTSMMMNQIKVNAEPNVMRAIGDIFYFTTAIDQQ